MAIEFVAGLPSGKLRVCYGKSPSSVGKSTIFLWAMFNNSYVTNYQTINGPCSIANFNGLV